jgi:hypothetical protein
LSSVTELIGERLPALSTAWTLNVFDVCVPYVSVVGCVVAVTAALGSEALPDGSSATTVNEYVVAGGWTRTDLGAGPILLGRDWCHE